MTTEGEEIPRDRYGHRRSPHGPWNKGQKQGQFGMNAMPPKHEHIAYNDGRGRFCAICGKRLEDVNPS